MGTPGHLDCQIDATAGSPCQIHACQIHACQIHARQIHASCVARGSAGVLLTGPAGSGKSELALRLLDCGFVLVADDRVDVENGIARPPAALAGLLEVRGLGIVALPHAEQARLRLVVDLAASTPRLPEAARDPRFGLPLIGLQAAAASAPARIALALDCVLGRAAMLAGALAP